MAAIQSLGTTGNEALAIDAARSASAGARRAALRILSYFGYGTAIDVFSEAMHDPDTRVRDVAIVGVALLENPRARALLLTAAEDKATQVRTAAMRGLGQSAAESDVIAALRRGLRDQEAWVRYYACQSLGKLRVQAVAADIAELLVDSAGQVRVAAVEALSRLKSVPALAALSSAAASPEPDVMRAALIGLSMMQDMASLPVLISACTAADAATRLVALSALSAFRTPEALAVVARSMNDDDEGVRVSAIGLLGSWPEREATRLLITTLRNERSRAHVARALSMPVHGRVEGLLGGLAHADDELAPTLTSLLGRVDPMDETGALFDALRLPNVAARKAAAAMLAAKGGRAALAALTRQAAEDESDEVRRVCALLLTQ
jgi:HEAT repeat protein